MVKRFYKDRKYIGVMDHQRDSWGAWQDITTIKIFYGKPSSLYDDAIYEFTPDKWAELIGKIRAEAKELNREFVITAHMVTSYPIWHS